ncbi:MAG: DUF1592 domain-containing protein, partial [Planctomycetota bacterium]
PKPGPANIGHLGFMANPQWQLANTFGQLRPRSRFLARGFRVLAVMLLGIGFLEQSILAKESKDTHQAFLTENCMDCHSGSEAEAGLDLEPLMTTGLKASNEQNFATWVRIYDRIESGEMPPQDSGYEIDPEQQDQLLATLKSHLKEQASQRYASGGRVSARRLTNLQLERTLHSILGVDIPLAREMPEPPRSEAYSTEARYQAFSHFHVEQHLHVVDLALDEAFRRALSPPDEWTRELSAKQISRTRTRTREPEYINEAAVVWSSTLSFYGRLPATTARRSGWYRFEFDVSSLNTPKDHGVFCTVRTGQCVSSAPLLSWVGSFEASKKRKTVVLETWIPRDQMLEIRPGDRTLRMARFRGGQSANGEGGKQNVPGIQIHGMKVSRVHQGAEDEQIRNILFGDLEIRTARASSLEQALERCEIKLPASELKGKARGLIGDFAFRAFRRPASGKTVDFYYQVFEEAFEGGESFAEALHGCYRAILCSARFLYLYEEPGTLDAYALASRLSYFLWNSPPDDELYRSAASKAILRAGELAKQVDRMLADELGKSFVPDFAAEWLQLRDIDFTQPDTRLFRDFDPIVQNEMLDETHAYLQHALDQNQSVSRLVQSDFTFLNNRLARYYGIENVEGDKLRKVSLRDGQRGGGLLSQGSILKVTANGTSTSPVLRGVWVARRILGQEIADPPENVPAIEPDIRGATTIREQLEKHRSQPDCASCHSKIDAPGFALESFDPTGKWRDYYSRSGKKKQKVDASYTTRDGKDFAGFDEFCSIVASDPESLAKNLLNQFLCYGTGAEIGFADRDEINTITKQLKSDDYRIRSILIAAVRSQIFRTK